MESVTVEESGRQRGSCLVCEMLAYDEALVRHRNVYIEELCESYQAVAREALQEIARLTRDRDFKGCQLRAVREEYAAFRAAVMTGAQNASSSPRFSPVAFENGRHMAATRSLEVHCDDLQIAKQPHVTPTASVPTIEGAPCH